MSNENNTMNNENAAVKTENTQDRKKVMDQILTPEVVRSMLRAASAGSLPLDVPLKADKNMVSELKFDFSQITALELVDSLDSDMDATNNYKITARQALAIFACAAGKCNPGLDKTDIMQRLSPSDSVKAIHVATNFFVLSSRVARQDSTKA